MLVIPWWLERMNTKSIFHDKKLWDDHQNWVTPILDEPCWPSGVYKRALYEDYCSWVGDREELIQDSKFYTIMSPFIYIGSVKSQTIQKNISVDKVSEVSGDMVRVRKRGRFVQLLGVDTHLAMYDRNIYGGPAVYHSQE